MTKAGHRSQSFRRVLAFAIDWGVFLLWGCLLFAAVMLATNGDPQAPASPWIAQAIGFVSVTMPFTLYFAIFESSRWRASIGKRVVGLIAVRQSGERLSLRHALLRNAIKFTPWELGHTVAQQAFYAQGDAFPGWLWGPVVLSMIGPIWWIAGMYISGEPPYNRWTGVRITSASSGSTPRVG